MALDTVPWFIGGGAEHSPAVARMLAYSATNGATGVNAVGDLKVTALPTPGASVRIAPGGACMENRYPGGGQQSYVVRNASATDVAVSATGSSGGATRYLILRIDDPEFGGAVPANVKTGPYVRAVLVTSITNLAYPFVPLAKITQPANTATITQAMITDLREVANPRSYRRLFLSPVTAAKDLSASTMTAWPGPTASVDIPSWATYANILGQVIGASQSTGPVYGESALRFNGVQGPASPYDINTGSSVMDGARAHPLVMKWEGNVSAVAGTTKVLDIFARKGGGAGTLRADTNTQVMLDVEFTEVAV